MHEQQNEENKIPAREMAGFILDAGAFLMASGAHSGRVWRNCKRMAGYWGFHINLNPTFTGIMVTVWDEKDNENAVTLYKTAPSNVINLSVLTLISHLSWRITDGELSFAEARQQLDHIRQRAHYPYWVIALAVGLSCGCLCKLAGADLADAAVTFVAASLGSVVRYFILRKEFNLFLSFILASFVTTMVAGMDTMFDFGGFPELTLATSVLYLIPGVPLLNSVIDLLEGYFPASISRSLYAASILTCIAVGMTLSIMFLGISNFK